MNVLDKFFQRPTEETAEGDSWQDIATPAQQSPAPAPTPQAEEQPELQVPPPAPRQASPAPAPTKPHPQPAPQQAQPAPKPEFLQAQQPAPQRAKHAMGKKDAFESVLAELKKGQKAPSSVKDDLLARYERAKKGVASMEAALKAAEDADDEVLVLRSEELLKKANEELALVESEILAFDEGFSLFDIAEALKNPILKGVLGNEFRSVDDFVDALKKDEVKTILGVILTSS